MATMTTDHAHQCAEELIGFWHELGTSDVEAIIARHIAAAVAEKTRELRALLSLMTPADPCRLDHHGNCQEHGWFHLNGDPCPVAEAQKLLGKVKP
jgi:hypothetical protein